MNEAPVHPSTSATASTVKPPRRLSVRIVLWILIFGSGMVVGVGLTLIAVRQGALNAIHHPELMPAKISQRLERPLRLTSEQRQQVEQILVERQLRLADIRRRFQPELEAELDVIHEQIGEVLDAQQKERWDRYFEHARQTWLPEMP